jgi:hypothetical protein
VKKKATEEAVKKATANAATAKKATGDAATMGSGSSLAPSARAKRVAAPVALHLRPSGDSLAPGSLGMSRNPSFIISCTTSVILI